MASYSYTTKLLSVNSAKAFLQKSTMVHGSTNNQDTSTSKKSQILYLCIGNSKPWPNDEPIYPPDNVQYLRYDLQRNFIGCVKVDAGSMCHVTNRYDWNEGTVYDMWRDTDVDMYEKMFYVLTSDYNVYKCLYNNKGAASRVEPRGFSTIPFTTSDGYTWKYMYTISLGDANKFLTANYMPVRTIEENSLDVCGCSLSQYKTKETCEAGGGIWTCSAESDKQLRIQNAAVDGGIHVIEVNDAGERYTYTADTDGLVAAATATTIRLSTAVQNPPSPLDNFYNMSSVYISSGKGAGQIRRIVDYVSETNTLTVHRDFDTIPDITSTVIISPTVTIIGDGEGATAYARVNTSTRAISNVNVVDSGSSYTRAEVLFSANTSSSGTGASANAMISPVNGHGSDPVEELYADKIMIDVQLDGIIGTQTTGAGYIPTRNVDGVTGNTYETTYRTITLLSDPILKVDSNNVEVDTENVANTVNSPNSLRATTKLNIAYGSDIVASSYLDINETITTDTKVLAAKNGQLEFVTELDIEQLQDSTFAMENATKAANGDIVYIEDDSTLSDPTIYNIYINNVESYGTLPGFSRESKLHRRTVEGLLCTVESINGPEFKLFSGDILFTENVEPVTRDPDQIENIKIVLDF